MCPDSGCHLISIGAEITRNYYQWLDAPGTQECGENVATFVMNKTREQIIAELSKILGTNARVYLIGPGLPFDQSILMGVSIVTIGKRAA